LYDYITRHFIASLSTDAKYDKIKIKFSLGGEFFSYSGKRIISEGFTSLMPWMKSKDEVKIDMLEKGDQLPVAAVEVKEEQTSPPPYLSESDLISLVRFKFFVRIFDKQKRLVLMLTFALLDGKAWHRY
jgi:DNA topoisomerase-3